MRWFIFMVSFLKTSTLNIIKTVRVITSWITFSSTREKGPPFSRNPILLAGTWKKYSKRAIPQLIRITTTSGRAWNHEYSFSFRWPYHAKVINMLERTSRAIVSKIFISVIWSANIASIAITPLASIFLSHYVLPQVWRIGCVLLSLISI